MQLPMGSGSPPSSIASEQGTTTPITSAAPNGDARLHLAPAELPPAQTRLANLVEAIDLVARAATARIAFHENAIEQIRKALAPFQNLAAKRQGAAGGDDAVDKLLAIAKQFGQPPPGG